MKQIKNKIDYNDNLILFFYSCIQSELEEKVNEFHKIMRQKLHREYLIKLFVKYEDIIERTNKNIKEFNTLKDLIKNVEDDVLINLTNLNSNAFFENVKIKLNEMSKNKEIQEIEKNDIQSKSRTKDIILNENDEDYFKNKINYDLKLDSTDSEKINFENEKEIENQSNKNKEELNQSKNITKGNIER
uniref:Uncharacterized protein n=1 Tax=Meloidogyne hapla TaxID=6305 RepID=A0A1I8BC79_MELHA